jgi:hypothetical protein
LEMSSYLLLGYKYDETIQASTGILAVSMGFLKEKLSYIDPTNLNQPYLFPSRVTSLEPLFCLLYFIYQRKDLLIISY